MPSVTQILDRASRITGLRDTGTERELALDALNDVYLEACMMVQPVHKEYVHTFQSAQDVYSIENHEELDFSGGTPPYPKLRDDDIQIPPFFRIIHVTYNSGGNIYPLRHVSENELLEHRRTRSLTGFPRIYSMSGRGLMRIWPRPLPGHELTITFAPVPRELTEGTDRPPALWDEAVWDLSEWDDDRGAESTPSQVPIQFHWSVLLAGTVVQMLDKDQRSEEAAFWQQRFEDGLYKMSEWMAMYGGDPATVLDEQAVNYGRYPDEWNRGQ